MRTFTFSQDILNAIRYDRSHPRLQHISNRMEVGGLITEVSEKTSVDIDSGWKAISRDPSASLSTLSG